VTGDPRCIATTLAVETKASQGKGTLSDFLEKIDAICSKLATGSSIGLNGSRGQVMSDHCVNHLPFLWMIGID